ncbi:MAG: folate family ECF transporter S component [Clostridiales bacterium]|nr:folate family ECF transporter S component [Clostridiales bacterium]
MSKIKAVAAHSLRAFSTPKNIALCGVMGALAIVLNMVATINVGPYLRIGFSGIPNRIIECLFGPVAGCIFGGVMDILKFVVKPSGPFFFGFTLNAMLAGVLYGLILSHGKLTVIRVFFAELSAKVFVNCILNTFWLSMLYGEGFLVLLPARIIKNAVMLPVDTAITFIVLTALLKIPSIREIAKRNQ